MREGILNALPVIMLLVLIFMLYTRNRSLMEDNRDLRQQACHLRERLYSNIETNIRLEVQNRRLSEEIDYLTSVVSPSQYLSISKDGIIDDIIEKLSSDEPEKKKEKNEMTPFDFLFKEESS